MARTIAQLTEEQRTWIDGYARGDAQKFQAIVLGFFEEMPSRAVERETGMNECAVRRLIADFRAAYDDWVKRWVKMGEIEDGGLEAHRSEM